MSEYHFRLFSQCIADLADNVKRVEDFYRGGILTSYLLEKAARDTSVAIRKVLIDHGGQLFKKCVNGPKLHPLKKPNRSLGEEHLDESFDSMRIYFTTGSSDVPRSFEAPGYTHRTVVKSLYGLRRVGAKKYRFDDLFDRSGLPLKFGRWMNVEVLQVGEEKIKASQPTLVAIMVTAYAGTDGAERAKNVGARHVLRKPVDFDKLLGLIAEVAQ